MKRGETRPGDPEGVVGFGDGDSAYNLSHLQGVDFVPFYKMLDSDQGYLVSWNYFDASQGQRPNIGPVNIGQILYLGKDLDEWQQLNIYDYIQIVDITNIDNYQSGIEDFSFMPGRYDATPSQSELNLITLRNY